MKTMLLHGWQAVAQCPLERWNRWGVRLALGAGVLVAGTLAVQAWQARQPQYLPTTQTLTLHGQTFALEVAETEAQKQKGLQARPPLPPTQGMLFPFAPSRSVSFWLWRTLSLDLLFLRQDTVVGLSLQLPPCTLMPDHCPLYHSPGLVTDVVELPPGSLAGVRVGDHVTRLPRAPTAGRHTWTVAAMHPCGRLLSDPKHRFWYVLLDYRLYPLW